MAYQPPQQQEALPQAQIVTEPIYGNENVPQAYQVPTQPPYVVPNPGYQSGAGFTNTVGNQNHHVYQPMMGPQPAVILNNCGFPQPTYAIDLTDDSNARMLCLVGILIPFVGW